jgi:LacI family transcriptional regulator, repressor for deo operon, udp, cdd, tsx, nupC, and nupG
MVRIPMDRTRLADVAERAGVSESTVSRVVNGRPGVREATRQQVLAALADLGYALPGLGRAHRAGLVGLVIPELSNPIFPAFAQTIETGLASRGYTTILCTATEGGVAEEEYVEMLLERGIAGLVVVSGHNADATADHDMYRQLTARGLPLVLVNGVVNDLDVPFVSCDDSYASELAVRHLASLGHRSVGMVVGPMRYTVSRKKVAGFESAVDALGLRGSIVESLYSVEGGHVAARRLLDAGVTGMVAASDLMALGVVRSARDTGRLVPDEVSVIGFDDTPLIACTDPPLTTVRQPVSHMSDAVVRALLERVQGHGGPAHEYVFRPDLVVRSSTAPPPGRGSGSGRRTRARAG